MYAYIILHRFFLFRAVEGFFKQSYEKDMAKTAPY